jgi:phosphate transport system permease protein
LTALGWFVGRAKARALYTGKGSLHSLPAHHGWHLALWILIPALAGWLIWSIVSPGLVHSAIMLDPAAASLPAMEMERDAIISEAFQLASDPARHGVQPCGGRAGSSRSARPR